MKNRGGTIPALSKILLLDRTGTPTDTDSDTVVLSSCPCHLSLPMPDGFSVGHLYCARLIVANVDDIIRNINDLRRQWQNAAPVPASVGADADD